MHTKSETVAAAVDEKDRHGKKNICMHSQLMVLSREKRKMECQFDNDLISSL